MEKLHKHKLLIKIRSKSLIFKIFLS